MSDRELLELAAKAAGITGVIGFDYRGFHVGTIGSVWNPLNDDGDALRLAVTLHLFDAGNFMAYRLEETRSNPTVSDYEITRRAIVRAAAEIGKAMTKE